MLGYLIARLTGYKTYLDYLEREKTERLKQKMINVLTLNYNQELSNCYYIEKIIVVKPRFVVVTENEKNLSRCNIDIYDPYSVSNQKISSRKNGKNVIYSCLTKTKIQHWPLKYSQEEVNDWEIKIFAYCSNYCKDRTLQSRS